MADTLHSGEEELLEYFPIKEEIVNKCRTMRGSVFQLTEPSEKKMNLYTLIQWRH